MQNTYIVMYLNLLVFWKQKRCRLLKKTPVVYSNNLREYTRQVTLHTFIHFTGIIKQQTTETNDIILFDQFWILWMELWLRNVLDLKSGRYRVQTSDCCGGAGAVFAAPVTLICISSLRRFWALWRWVFILTVGLDTTGLGGGTGLTLPWVLFRKDTKKLSALFRSFPKLTLVWWLVFVRLLECISNFR